MAASPTLNMAGDTSAVFLDTAFLNARINTSDQWHAVAVHWERRIVADRRNLLTTEFILIEYANSLASVRFRDKAVESIAALRTNATIEFVPASSTLFEAGLDLYARRRDKDWGLTDCISFVVMHERAMVSALTTDEHFRQAGFLPLLLDDL